MAVIAGPVGVRNFCKWGAVKLLFNHHFFWKLWVLPLLLGLNACNTAQDDRVRAQPKPLPFCMEGQLTDEGAKCQAMRGVEGNHLVTFFADMNTYRLGERVCICGAPARMSQCEIGYAIDIEYLGRGCPDPAAILRNRIEREGHPTWAPSLSQ